MRAIDTNVLVRLIARDDPKQVAAADEFVRGGAWVSLLVLAETMWVMESVYESSPHAIATAVEMLLDHESLTIQDRDVAAAAVARFRSKPRLGFSDCLIVEIARRAGHIPVGTFDRELAKVPDTSRLRG